MHLVMILVALGLAWWLRSQWSYPAGSWTERASRALNLFLFPPLLLLTTAFAIFWMGPHGQMVWGWGGWLSYGLAIGFLLTAGILCLHLAWQGRQTLQVTRSYRQVEIDGTTARAIDVPILYCALVGFWQPELIVTQGLLDTCDRDRLQAVLAHERGHLHYRDTFWFFWLGWLRRLSVWLPHTESLWQELLVLRELRADRWATFQVDALLLAESLLIVVNTPPLLEECCAAFASAVPSNRLEQRIDALLAEPQSMHQPNLRSRSWVWLLLAFLPLLAIPFHT